MVVPDLNEEFLHVVKRSFPEMLTRSVEDSLDTTSPYYETKLLLHGCSCNTCAFHRQSRKIFKHCSLKIRRPKQNICKNYTSIPTINPVWARSRNKQYVLEVVQYPTEDNKRS